MGFIRYQTVRNIGLGALGAGAVAGIVALASGGKDVPPTRAPIASTPASPLASPTLSPMPLTAPPPAPPAPVPPPGALLDDAAIAARADRPASPGEKVKDAFTGNAVKVNLYEETQDGRYDRLKVDRNRDDVWDEQWSRKDGGPWTKEDGSTFVGGQWVTAGAAAPPTSPPPVDPTSPATTPATATEPYATQLAAVAKMMLGERASGPKLKDVFRGTGPKVNLYDDDKDGTWDRAKVDYDRDEVDDEKLTLKGGTLERHDEKSGVVKVWADGAWKAKP